MTYQRAILTVDKWNLTDRSISSSSDYKHSENSVGVIGLSRTRQSGTSTIAQNSAICLYCSLANALARNGRYSFNDLLQKATTHVKNDAIRYLTCYMYQVYTCIHVCNPNSPRVFIFPSRISNLESPDTSRALTRVSILPTSSCFLDIFASFYLRKVNS